VARRPSRPRAGAYPGAADVWYGKGAPAPGMFLTITLNPALDKTLWVESNAPFDTIRVQRLEELAGGKGLNVARALRGLGAPVLALAPLGGHAGEYVAHLAREEGIEMRPVRIAGTTRTALTLREHGAARYWHYLEPGPALGAAELAAIEAAFEEALPAAHTVIVSGSVPCAGAAPLVARLLERARARGRRTALDSFGAGLHRALRGGAWLVKPNLLEWKATTGEELHGDPARRAALARLAGWGTEAAVLSLGAEGAMAFLAGRHCRLRSPAVDTVSDLGCGDAMVAAMCWAAHRGLEPRACLAWGGAAGAANAATHVPGGITRSHVEGLLPAVQVGEE